MGQKKGKMPPHIQTKTFTHPAGNTPWILILENVQDPRKPSCNTRHSVVTILFIVFTTVLCGAKNWEEIYHIAELISQLELKGAIVTADALHTQKDSANCIMNSGADYVLPVKENHPGLLEDIKLLFAEADALEFKGIDAAQTETIEKNGGRVESRAYALLSSEGLPPISEWLGCRCVGRVIRQRTKQQKSSEEVSYYITSLDFDIATFAKSCREHWSIENGLHWALDVIFREDQHRYQQRVGAANLSLMRKTALTILTNDKTLKCGRATKQVRALASATYRDHLLRNCFNGTEVSR